MMFGEQVRAKRALEGRSLRSLGETLGVSFSTIARIERGEWTHKQHVARKLQAWLFPDQEAPICHCVRCVPRAAHTGWQCPGCKRCYAPNIAQCLYCGPKSEEP